jgi:hypothetical protein
MAEVLRRYRELSCEVVNPLGWTASLFRIRITLGPHFLPEDIQTELISRELPLTPEKYQEKESQSYPCISHEVCWVVGRRSSRLTDGELVSLTHRPPFTPKDIPVYSFQLDLELTTGR